MYACMHIFMYICTYVCDYVTMYHVSCICICIMSMYDVFVSSYVYVNGYVYVYVYQHVYVNFYMYASISSTEITTVYIFAPRVCFFFGVPCGLATAAAVGLEVEHFLDICDGK